jgi:PhzF family phenazine biosynthesis protein
MSQKIFQVDAFTKKPYTGNPAAVCILQDKVEEKWMQGVALEMNLSETAFLVQQEDGFNLRWFTPAIEVELCGHATLASAHILYEENYLKPEEIAKFHTQSGLLTAKNIDPWIEMDFPAKPEQPTAPPQRLIEALGIMPIYVGQNQFDYLVVVESEQFVRDMSPDFSLLKSLPIRGVIVTSLSELPEYDFVSRFFAPAAGINEDPVTGSAHCCLGPYWSKQLGITDLTAFQASQRGGVVKVSVSEDRVLLRGEAVTIMQGELYY